jgi:hypothetical protein
MDTLPLDDRTLPVELGILVRAELRDGERLLWAGQPRPGRFARLAWLDVIFGIPWTLTMIALLAFLIYTNLQDAPRAQPAAPRWAGLVVLIPFLLIGFAHLSAPYWAKRRARRTVYAITDRRVIVWEGKKFRPAKVHSLSPAELTRLHRVEHSGGVGDLIFDDCGEVRHWTGSSRKFVAIDGVREVEDLVRTALLAREGEPSNA